MQGRRWLLVRDGAVSSQNRAPTPTTGCPRLPSSSTIPSIGCVCIAPHRISPETLEEEVAKGEGAPDPQNTTLIGRDRPMLQATTHPRLPSPRSPIPLCDAPSSIYPPLPKNLGAGLGWGSPRSSVPWPAAPPHQARPAPSPCLGTPPSSQQLEPTATGRSGSPTKRVATMACTRAMGRRGGGRGEAVEE